MQVHKAFDGGKQAVAQAAFVRAAGAGGNQIDIAFAHRLAVFGKSHAPLRALAFGKAFVRGVGKAFAFKERYHRVARERLRQVVAQAAFVKPGLGFFGFFVDEGDADAGHQHSLAAQQVRQVGHGQGRGFKVFGVGPGAHRGAGLPVALAGGADFQGFNDVAT